MKSFLFLLTLLILSQFSQAKAKKTQFFYNNEMTKITVIDTLMTVDVPNANKIKKIYFAGDTLFIEGIEKTFFYEIKDGPGLIPLTRDKKIVFRSAYPKEGKPVIIKKTIITDWEYFNSIYYFWIIFLGVNLFFGLFFKEDGQTIFFRSKKNFLISQGILNLILLGILFYFQASGRFSDVFFVILDLAFIIGFLSGIIWHHLTKSKFHFFQLLFSYDSVFLVCMLLYIGRIQKNFFSLPPKAFYLTVMTVAASFLILPLSLFIRKK